MGLHAEYAGHGHCPGMAVTTMPNYANRNHRNQRNNPYAFDDLAVKFHRSAAGVAWRWRSELITIAAGIFGVLRLAQAFTLTGAALILGASLAGLLALPPTRRLVTRRFWCVLARHRIQRLCWEARLHTRAGRLPLVLWTRPTKVGERAWLLCRAGICAEDFEAHIGELRAACYARDARVTRNTGWSQLVTIDIIRRDTLAPKEVIPTPLTSVRIRPPAGAAEPAQELNRSPRMRLTRSGLVPARTRQPARARINGTRLAGIRHK